MKKTLCFTAAFLGTLLLLSSCSKDLQTNPGGGLNTYQNNPIEQLKDFRQKLTAFQTNTIAKSDETMSLTEALWDIENNFNITYTDAEQYYSCIKNHEFTLSIPVDGEQHVLTQDAVGLYWQMVEQARQALCSEKSDQRAFVSLSIKETEETDGVMTVTFIGKTGQHNEYIPAHYYLAGPFTNDDNWMFASPMGKCDDPDIPSGADEQLQEKLFDTLIGSLEKAHPGYRNVYLDRLNISYDGNDYIGLFYSEDCDNCCIPYYRMNSILYVEMKLINSIIPQQYHLISGYKPISIAIYGIQTDDHSACTHHHEVSYGIRHQIPIEEFGDVVDLAQP